MAVLIEVPERQYQPNEDAEITLGVPAGSSTITITVIREDWPEGPCVRYELLWNGRSDGITEVGGGVVRDKAGNPTGGTLEVTRTATVPPDAIAVVARVELLKRLRCAVRVESD